jgi:hypothetical protein
VFEALAWVCPGEDLACASAAPTAPQRALPGRPQPRPLRRAPRAERACQLAGRAFNIASAAQVAVVLYKDLGLPAPGGSGALRAACAFACFT